MVFFREVGMSWVWHAEARRRPYRYALGWSVAALYFLGLFRSGSSAFTSAVGALTAVELVHGRSLAEATVTNTCLGTACRCRQRYGGGGYRRPAPPGRAVVAGSRTCCQKRQGYGKSSRAGSSGEPHYIGTLSTGPAFAVTHAEVLHMLFISYPADFDPTAELVPHIPESFTHLQIVTDGGASFLKQWLDLDLRAGWGFVVPGSPMYVVVFVAQDCTIHLVADSMYMWDIVAGKFFTDGGASFLKQWPVLDRKASWGIVVPGSPIGCITHLVADIMYVLDIVTGKILTDGGASFLKQWHVRDRNVGCGFVVVPGSPVYCGAQQLTNNAAELSTFIEALVYVVVFVARGCPTHLVADSMYALGIVAGKMFTDGGDSFLKQWPVLDRKAGFGFVGVPGTLVQVDKVHSTVEVMFTISKSHTIRRHGHRRPSREYVQDSTCLVCHMSFFEQGMGHAPLRLFLLL